MRGDTLQVVPLRDGSATMLLSDLGMAVAIADQEAAVVVHSFGQPVDKMLLQCCAAWRDFSDIYFAPDRDPDDWKLCAEYLVARGCARWLSHKDGFANRVIAVLRKWPPAPKGTTL